jgi:GMP synthase (glutamine-hydrolysing)
LSASTNRIRSPLHGQRFGRWLVGHAAELAGARIDIVTLREDAAKFGPAQKEAGRALVKEWLWDTAL